MALTTEEKLAKKRAYAKAHNKAKSNRIWPNMPEAI